MLGKIKPRRSPIAQIFTIVNIRVQPEPCVDYTQSLQNY